MPQFNELTEQPSTYSHLERMTIKEIISHINNEDKTVAFAVEKSLPQIEKLVEAIKVKMLAGGKLFYIGAGTSGRLGILDASECPPTYGIPSDKITGIIAGGLAAVAKAQEAAEDNIHKGFKDLKEHNITVVDVVVGITASGTTPYVYGALKDCKKQGIVTGCITSNPESPIAKIVDYLVEVIVGPEFVTGSSRMKSGTAQKFILNMISTTVMIQMGRVADNGMINMQLNNEKLVNRGVKMLMDKTGILDYEKAKELLLKSGSVKNALEAIQKK